VKKPYTKPAIMVSLKMESRAVQCSKANDTCAATGPITSWSLLLSNAIHLERS